MHCSHSSGLEGQRNGGGVIPPSLLYLAGFWLHPHREMLGQQVLTGSLLHMPTLLNSSRIPIRTVPHTEPVSFTPLRWTLGLDWKVIGRDGKSQWPFLLRKSTFLNLVLYEQSYGRFGFVFVPEERIPALETLYVGPVSCGKEHSLAGCHKGRVFAWDLVLKDSWELENLRKYILCLSTYFNSFIYSFSIFEFHVTGTMQEHHARVRRWL